MTTRNESIDVSRNRSPSEEYCNNKVGMMERIQSQLFLSSKNYWMTVSPPFKSYWLPITKCPLFMMLKVVCWFRPGAPVGGSMHYGRAVRIFNSYQSPSRSSTRLNQAISNSACLVGLIPECWILSLHRVAPSPNCVLTSERTGMLTLLSAPDSRYNIQIYPQLFESTS